MKAEETCKNWHSLFDVSDSNEEDTDFTDTQIESICPNCNGSGENPYSANGEGTCKTCHGRGTIE